MTNWKLIHSDFTSRLQQQWEKNSFTYNQTQDWINIGLTPHDCSFVVYLRDILKCEPEEALNFVSDIEELRVQYQEYLQSQNEESEEDQLVRAMALSLGIFNFTDNPSKGLTDEEAEQYLSTKRLNLKKYFVFNLGKELSTIPVTVSDYEGKTVSEPIPNLRRVEPLLSEHLTQLFDDNQQKLAISFTGKNTNQPSQAWTGNKLDQKIKNGEEVYIIFDKRRIKANSSYVRSKADSTTQLGELDWPIVVLAMEAKPQVQVFQSKKNALKFLRENDFKCRVVSCKEEIIGEEDYCLYHQTCLAKLDEQKSIPNIQEIDTFETWFNGNCGYVINKDNAKFPFHIWLVVYEPEYGKVEEKIFPMRFWKAKNLVDAHKKAQEIKKKLEKGSVGFNPFAVANPFCLIHWKADEYTTFADLTSELYVRKIEVPIKLEIKEPNNPCDCYPACDCPACNCSSRMGDIETIYPDNLDDHLKPLDVVWVKKESWGNVYHHVGVYLGDNKVCHYSGADKKQYRAKVIITDWKTFIVNHTTDGETFAYRPIIPFKHYELIAQQIDRAVDNDYWEGRYCLANNNCEHRANSFVFGIDYSKQVNERPSKSIGWCKKYRGQCIGKCKSNIANDSKGLTVKLTDEITKTNAELDNSTGQWYKEIKGQYEAKTVVPSKNCKIM